MSIYTKIMDIQKLREAWNRVKRNKPACGADEVTYETFDANVNAEIKQLNLELKEYRYKVFPVKLVKIQKEEKVREVSLYTMRDKLVQASVANELTQILERQFSPCAYAYRNSLSAMTAIGRIEKYVLEGKYHFVCKTDIKSFFDRIPLDILKKKLYLTLKEEDVVELIMQILHAPSMDGNGDLTEKKVGIYQGAGISPVLSNLFLSEFDRVMEKEKCLYIRYADDILVLTETQEEMQLCFTKMKDLLESLRLQLNGDKTLLGEIKNGFDFLGYHFDCNGKSIPVKATEKLRNSLEDVWLTMVGASLEERLRKGSQILEGWEQFYRGERPIHDIYEYVVLVYMLRYKNELVSLVKEREKFTNTYRDIAGYLITVWKENDLYWYILLEYEQYYGIADGLADVQDVYGIKEILGIYCQLWKNESEELWLNLLQSYTDLGLYDRSEKVMNRIQKKRGDTSGDLNLAAETGSEEPYVTTNSGDFAEKMELFFRGREDMYARELLCEERRKCEFVPEPLTRDVIEKHLSGSETIATYVVRNNDTVHYLVWDIDVSRKVLLRPQEYDFEYYLNEAGKLAMTLYELLQNMGLKTFIEFSRFRGYHVWLFLSEWLPTRYAYALQDVVEAKLGELPENITVENFPSKTKRKIGSAGVKIKLPFGLHLISGKRSCFVAPTDLQPLDQSCFFHGVVTYTTENVKRVIGANNTSESRINSHGSDVIGLDYEKLGNISENIRVVLEGCNLMKYLVNKSVNTGYLSHMERLAILNVFGHVGEEGKEFVHTVMSFTLNYQYNVTQKFINRLPEKPVSCIKLRDQYKQITAEYGCSCVFKRTKNCYPSPVLHAIKKSSDLSHDVTIPASRYISAEKKEKVYGELNSHVKVQELAEKIVELKKQKRGIDKAIQKVEIELEQIFDSQSTDCMEVDMGMLVRRKTASGHEWVIEI